MPHRPAKRHSPAEIRAHQLKARVRKLAYVAGLVVGLGLLVALLLVWVGVLPNPFAEKYLKGYDEGRKAGKMGVYIFGYPQADPTIPRTISYDEFKTMVRRSVEGVCPVAEEKPADWSVIERQDYVLGFHSGYNSARSEAANRLYSDAPLHYAAMQGDLRGLRRMLDAGHKANELEPNTRATALFWAVVGNHPRIVEELLAAKAQVNAEDGGYRTPLDWAILRDNAEMADLLRRHGGRQKLHVRPPQ